MSLGRRRTTWGIALVAAGVAALAAGTYILRQRTLRSAAVNAIMARGGYLDFQDYGLGLPQGVTFSAVGRPPTLTSADLISLKQELREVKRLNLSNTLVDAEVLDLLASLRDLRELVLPCDRMDDRGMARLRHIEVVVEDCP